MNINIKISRYPELNNAFDKLKKIQEKWRSERPEPEYKFELRKWAFVVLGKEDGQKYLEEVEKLSISSPIDGPPEVYRVAKMAMMRFGTLKDSVNIVKHLILLSVARNEPLWKTDCILRTL